MKSMTGFGRSSLSGKNYDISVEISSLNRKNLEISVTLPREWSIFEKDIQDLAKKYILRGKAYINVVVTNTDEALKLNWDEPVISELLSRLKELADQTGIEFKPDTDFLLKIVQIVSQSEDLPADDSVQDDLIKSVGEALEHLVEMRTAEGNKLKEDLEERVSGLGRHLEDLKPHTVNTAARYKEVLLDRLKQSGLDLDLDDERVLKEISIYADRCDVSEELTRIDSHISQFNDAISAEGLIGRKLDFLCQELNREINTTGSKAGNVEVTKIVIEMKNELERIREQVQNVE